MNASEIAQLAIILAPITKNIIVEGGKIVASFREDINQEHINQSLELSRSANWPVLTFAPTAAVMDEIDCSGYQRAAS